MTIDQLPDFIRTHYEVHEWKHATAILWRTTFPPEWQDIIAVLTTFRLLPLRDRKHLADASLTSPDALDSGVYPTRLGGEVVSDTSAWLMGEPLNSPTHEVDCYKNRIALEIEWNNKDPFFDRDLEQLPPAYSSFAWSASASSSLAADELQSDL